MIFSLIILIVVGVIAYYHYAQGLFSATMSALSAIVAAALAISYHEVMINTLLQGKAADHAHALCLVAIFSAVYVTLRLILDKVVPGYVALPLMVDRIGGGAVGVVAGIFTGGIVALAAQMLPFGPTILGFARYPVEDRPEVNVPASRSGGRARNADIHAQLKDKELTPDKRSKLLFPVDDIVLGFVEQLSNGGSMAGSRPLTSVHPNYPDELFAQRLGVQIGAQRTAVNLPGRTGQVTLAEPGLFRVDADLAKGQVDAEVADMHPRPAKWERGPSDLQLVVRVMFNKDAADADGMVRISTGAVRLVANGKNFFPVGTLEGTSTLMSNHPDDFLFVNAKAADRGADFVFFIPTPEDVVIGTVKDPEQKVKDGVFIEVKRLAKIDLSGKTIKPGVTPSKNVGVERKPDVLENAKMPPAQKPGEKSPEGGETAPTAPAAANPNAPFAFTKLEVARQMFTAINVGTGEADVKGGQLQSGTFSLQSKQFTELQIDPVQSLAVLRQGSYTIDELFEPAGMKLVQVAGAPPAEGGDAWAWASFAKWTLADAAGKTYPAAGGWAKVKKDQADRLAASYSAAGSPKDLSGDGRPTDVWLAFLVPSGTHLKELRHDGKMLTALDQAVP